jgi:hypothetical protein
MIGSCLIRCSDGKGLNAAGRGVAWVALCLALAIHVTDEALTDFLSVYNPAAQAIRERLPFLPLPTFTFEVWLGGLILAVIVLLSLSHAAFRGAWWMAPLSYLFGVLMLGNGLLHLAGSIYLGRAMPGVYSAPLLLGAAIHLLRRTRQHQQWSSARRGSGGKS